MGVEMRYYRSRSCSRWAVAARVQFRATARVRQPGAGTVARGFGARFDSATFVEPQRPPPRSSKGRALPAGERLPPKRKPIPGSINANSAH
jgi:hypothetical protein